MKRLLCVAALLVACSSEDPEEAEPVEEEIECPEVLTDLAHHVVVVRDAMIDPRNPALAGKVNGCYTIVCDGDPPPTIGSMSREQFIASYAKKNTQCRLQKGLRVVRSSSFDKYSFTRDSWNSHVLSKQPLSTHPSVGKISSMLEGEGRFNYHGTTVASTIAFDNPDVRFVLIADGSILRPGEQPKCPTFEEQSERMAMVADPEFVAAYANAPPSRLEDQLVNAYHNHNVTIINESYGRKSPAAYERLCPGLGWERYFELWAQADSARRAVLDTTLYNHLAVLTVRSAMNDSEVLDSAADHPACIAPATTRGVDSADLLIGSYGYASNITRSPFTNFGPCVHAFAPGEAVIAGFPEGWVAPVNGTSYAAPLVTRFLTKTMARTRTPKELRDAVLAARVADRNLPLDLFDRRMLYAGSKSEITASYRTLVADPVRTSD